MFSSSVRSHKRTKIITQHGKQLTFPMAKMMTIGTNSAKLLQATKMSQTILSPIRDLDNHGSFQRRVLEQLMPWCDKCEKAIADWMEPKNAKDWLEVHWRKKHTD